MKISNTDDFIASELHVLAARIACVAEETDASEKLCEIADEVRRIADLILSHGAE